MSLSDKLYVVGLTGQSGAGKSSVSRIFQKNGFPIIDADEISRSVAQTNEFLREVRELFPDCVDELGLDRKKLAAIVFNSPDKLKSYTDIIYPYITKNVLKTLTGFADDGANIVVLDAPTLFESGLNDICSVIVSVVAPMDIKIRRILERDGIPVEAVTSRLSAQKSEEYFTLKSDYVICNDADLGSLEAKTAEVISKIRERHNG